MRSARHSREILASAGAVLVLLGALVAVGCGGDADLPGEWVSARGEHVVIAARDDGDYDVTFIDANEERGEDTTFTLPRDGDKLVLDDPEDDFFIYVTLRGDSITIERVGNIQSYDRAD